MGLDANYNYKRLLVLSVHGAAVLNGAKRKGSSNHHKLASFSPEIAALLSVAVELYRIVLGWT